MTLFTDSEEIKVFLGGKPLNLVYFSAGDCSVCRELKPKIDELKGDFPQMGFAEVNLSRDIEPSAAFSVFTVPAVIVFAEGRETVRMARNISVYELKEKLYRYYKLLN